MAICRISAKHYQELLKELDEIDQRARKQGILAYWYNEYEEERLDYIEGIFECFLVYDDVPHLRLQEKEGIAGGEFPIPVRKKSKRLA